MDGSSDSYVTVSWGKFGKPMASTRVIVEELEPTWNEWATILSVSRGDQRRRDITSSAVGLG